MWFLLRVFNSLLSRYDEMFLDSLLQSILWVGRSIYTVGISLKDSSSKNRKLNFVRTWPGLGYQQDIHRVKYLDID